MKEMRPAFPRKRMPTWHSFALAAKQKAHVRHHLTTFLRQQGAFLGCRGLGSCDAVDDEANATLGNDVRDAISDLDCHHCVRAMEANHWEDVHNWVGQPADDCPVLGALDQCLSACICLCVGGSAHAHQEFV